MQTTYTLSSKALDELEAKCWQEFESYVTQHYGGIEGFLKKHPTTYVNLDYAVDKPDEFNQLPVSEKIQFISEAFFRFPENTNRDLVTENTARLKEVFKAFVQLARLKVFTENKLD